ncbi:hypothetical protein LTR17_016786 [Elasticomyces elasticus]|nr:hypothetical protein LTR17_016786 [Elasticomyces elasticus]
MASTATFKWDQEQITEYTGSYLVDVAEIATSSLTVLYTTRELSGKILPTVQAVEVPTMAAPEMEVDAHAIFGFSQVAQSIGELRRPK